MTRAALLLAVLLCLPARAEEVVDVRSATLLTAAGLTMEVRGGTWLSDAQTLRTGRELVHLRAERDALREAPPLPPLWTLGLALALGLGAGLAIGLAGR